MIRPMPGPPEKYQLLGPTVIVWEGGAGYYYHPSTMDAKRLTDAECAAEYWRAEAEEADARGRSWFYEDPDTVNAERLKASLAADRARAWHRFAHTPHALEVTP